MCTVCREGSSAGVQIGVQILALPLACWVTWNVCFLICESGTALRWGLSENCHGYWRHFYVFALPLSAILSSTCLWATLILSPTDAMILSSVSFHCFLSQAPITAFSVQMRWKLLNEIKPTQANKATVIIRADLVTTWMFSAKKSLREEKVPVETQWLRKHEIRRDAELYKVCCVRPPTTFTKGNLRTKVPMVS